MTDTRRNDTTFNQEQTGEFGVLERRERRDSTTKVNDDGVKEKLRTPLPKFQLFILLLIQFAEPITADVIYPFVNQFVRDTGITRGDDSKTGYYAGAIESAFFLAEAATVFQWGWLSDRLGRRPVLLLGPLGLTFAMLNFGCANTFWSMLLSRCFQGIFNGNIGVSKTVTAELSDSTNIGEAFALMPLMWSIGSTIAPIIGGVLSNPATRWPNVFGKLALFKEHPYFLPCLIAAVISFLTLVIGFLGLKETHPSRRTKPGSYRSEEHGQSSAALDASRPLLDSDYSDTPNYGTNSSTRCPSPTSPEALSGPLQKLTDSVSDSSSEVVSLRSMLTSRGMQLILANHMLFTFTDMAFFVLMPLVFSMPLNSGGLGLNPYQIGLIMGAWGVFNAFVQLGLLGKLIRKHGAVSVYRLSCSCFLMSFAMLPTATYLARRNAGVGLGSGITIAVMLFFQSFVYMGYGAIPVLVAETTPKSILGSINGVVQMAGCIMRTIAPTFASSLFSISIQKQLLGGYLVYATLYVIVVVGIYFSTRLADAER